MTSSKNRDTQIPVMRLKKHLTYRAEAHWDHKTGGIAQLEGFTQPFDTPVEHGGNETAPCPDQLFMASLAGCIMNTFGYYRTMLKVETIDLKVDVSSDIILTKTDGYRITNINIDMQVWSDEENEIMNQKCAERARDFCHITKSIEESIPIDVSIKVHVQ
ncbi:MAG: OsmC family protein [Candidatus Bathyarchaeota archaeon]|nr:OsmC family protein [Candidatus Bathyarchaeota archaeon]